MRILVNVLDELSKYFSLAIVELSAVFLIDHMAGRTNPLCV